MQTELRFNITADASGGISAAKQMGAELGNVGDKSVTTGKMGQGAMESMRSSMYDGRSAAALLGEEMGLRLPLSVDKFLARTDLIGPALASAFEASVFVAMGVALVKLIENFPKLLNSIEDVTMGLGESRAEMQKDADAMDKLGEHARKLRGELSLIGLTGIPKVTKESENAAASLADAERQANVLRGAYESLLRTRQEQEDKVQWQRQHAMPGGMMIGPGIQMGLNAMFGVSEKDLDAAFKAYQAAQDRVRTEIVATAQAQSKVTEETQREQIDAAKKSEAIFRKIAETEYRAAEESQNLLAEMFKKANQQLAVSGETAVRNLIDTMTLMKPPQLETRTPDEYMNKFMPIPQIPDQKQMDEATSGILNLGSAAIKADEEYWNSVRHIGQGTKDMSNAVSTAFTDMADRLAGAIMDWNNFAQSVTNIMKQFVQSMIRMLLEGSFSGGGGGAGAAAGSGILGKLFSGIFGGGGGGGSPIAGIDPLGGASLDTLGPGLGGGAGAATSAATGGGIFGSAGIFGGGAATAAFAGATIMGAGIAIGINKLQKLMTASARRAADRASAILDMQAAGMVSAPVSRTTQSILQTNLAGNMFQETPRTNYNVVINWSSLDAASAKSAIPGIAQALGAALQNGKAAPLSNVLDYSHSMP